MGFHGSNLGTLETWNLGARRQSPAGLKPAILASASLANRREQLRQLAFGHDAAWYRRLLTLPRKPRATGAPGPPSRPSGRFDAVSPELAGDPDRAEADAKPVHRGFAAPVAQKPAPVARARDCASARTASLANCVK